MPLYEYKCEKCSKVFEIIQRFSDEPLSTHPECGGKVERLISTSALHFKGSGFYITDYAKGSNAPAATGKSDGKSDSKSDGKAETKSDTKSESKSDSKSDSSPAPAAAPAATTSSDSSKK
jgi:putative FmdB family regulatory protein